MLCRAAYVGACVMHNKSRVTRCRRVAPTDLHPRPSPTSEVQVSRVSQCTVDLRGMTYGVQEARGRGPMRISSRGTVTHCRSITATALHFLIAILLPITHGMYVIQPHLFTFPSPPAPLTPPETLPASEIFSKAA